jgi:hypothetical protein
MSALEFKKPIAGVSKAKVLVIGDAGSGKTHFSLTFPKPVVLDTEGGTDLFGDRFPDFVANHSRSYRDIYDTIKTFATGKMPGETLVLDSITSIYNVLLSTYPDDQFLKKPKQDFRKLIDFLYGRLPCHVVMTAWEKTEYAKPGELVDDGSGGTKRVKAGELIPVGYKMEADQKALYAFDFVFRLWMDKKTKKRYATVIKSRSSAFKQDQVIENPSWDMLKDLVDKKPFVPIQTEDEAAEADMAANTGKAASTVVETPTQAVTPPPEVKPAAAVTPPPAAKAPPAAQKRPTVTAAEPPERGSNEHLNRLMARYNALAAEPLSARAYLGANGFITDASDVPTKEQRVAAAAHIEAAIAALEATQAKPKAEKLGLPTHLAK